MSSNAPGGGYRNEQVGLAFDPSGSNLPPPLRPQRFNQAQNQAALQLRFSDNCILTGGVGNGTNGRGNNLYYQPPSDYGSNFVQGGEGSGPEYFEVGQFSQEDCTDGGGGRGHYAAGQEGLVDPLRRPDINQIPPDVLAVLIKTGRFQEILGQEQRQQSQHQLTHNIPDSQLNSHPDSRITARNVNNDSNNRHSPQQRQPHLQERNYSNSPPQQQQQVQDRNYSTNSPQQKSHAPGRNYSPQQQPPQRHQNQNQITSTGSPSTAGSQQRFRTPPVNSNRGTTLSPWAKEFTPSGNMTMMNMQEESELAQAVAQIQMLNHNQTSSVDFSQGEYSNPRRNEVDSSNDNMDCIHQVLSTVTDAMTDLTLYPANFSRCSKTITEVLKNYLTDTDTVGVVVNLLVEQSITNPNFCYSGARLSQVLLKSEVAVGSATFKNVLLTRCQEEFGYCINNMEQHPETQMRSRGLLMFFAELFVNIRIEKAPGVTIPISVLGVSVIHMMQKLVKVKDTPQQNIKSVFQVLKLVGWELENSSSAQVKMEFETLVKDLSYLKCVSKTKPQTKLLLETLFELMSKKWNREESTEESTSVPPSLAASTAGYGSNYNVYEMPESDEEDYDETVLMIDDEPAEVQKAYDEFLEEMRRK